MGLGKLHPSAAVHDNNNWVQDTLTHKTLNANPSPTAMPPHHVLSPPTALPSRRLLVSQRQLQIRDGFVDSLAKNRLLLLFLAKTQSLAFGGC